MLVAEGRREKIKKIAVSGWLTLIIFLNMGETRNVSKRPEGV
jgi:hypothetical protein